MAVEVGEYDASGSGAAEPGRVGVVGGLGKEELLHRTGWEWDGLRLQAADGFVWTLSAETQGALREIEEMLRDGVVDEAEGVKVLVGVVPT